MLRHQQYTPASQDGVRQEFMLGAFLSGLAVAMAVILFSGCTTNFAAGGGAPTARGTVYGTAGLSAMQMAEDGRRFDICTAKGGAATDLAMCVQAARGFGFVHGGSWVLGGLAREIPGGIVSHEMIGPRPIYSAASSSPPAPTAVQPPSASPAAPVASESATKADVAKVNGRVDGLRDVARRQGAILKDHLVRSTK